MTLRLQDNTNASDVDGRSDNDLMILVMMMTTMDDDDD